MAQAASPSAVPSEALSAAEEKAAIINELRNEVSTLRRELRLLRIANAELERVAVRDTLTPLFNRRYFLTALNERLVRAQRYNTRSAVLFIDVNRMKRINDAFGHSAGDYALVHIAHLVQANIRATDVAARIGGDEFAIILEEVDEARAAAKADQLAEVMNETPCLFGARSLPVSASIGLTMLRPHDTEEALIERADADMYARKRAWHKITAASSALPPSALSSPALSASAVPAAAATTATPRTAA
ncbi:MAG: GGDEF domain-containing protein [Sphingobium sp.]